MSNLSLYKITSGFPALMESEEITEEDKIKIKEELTQLLQKKSQNIIGYIKNIELTIEAMKEEEKRIADNRKVLENKMGRFKEYVKECMERNGITKIETSLGVIYNFKLTHFITTTNKEKRQNYKLKITIIPILLDKVYLSKKIKYIQNWVQKFFGVP